MCVANETDGFVRERRWESRLRCSTVRGGLVFEREGVLVGLLEGDGEEAVALAAAAAAARFC